uniref:Glutamate receptor n=1 Tax=Eptatretus burgeri TaxID=7764 RepID=A0A8C4QTS2_EPTBU
MVCADIRGVHKFLEHTSRRGAEVSLQRVDSNVGAMITTLFRSLKFEELNRYRDMLRRAVLLLCPQLARTLIEKAREANLITKDSHWIYVNEEVGSTELQELALAASGRLTVVRQYFPAPEHPSQQCLRNRHHISPQLCNPEDPTYSVPKVSSRYIYDSVLLLSTAFHQKLEDRKWHSMASLNCLKKWTKPWNGGSSMLQVVKQGRVQGLSGMLEFNEEDVNPNVQFEILGTSYGDRWERTIKKLAIWDPKLGLNGTLQDHIPGQDIQGMTLQAVVVVEAPFVMASENVLGQPRHFVGFSLDVLGLLAAQLGFTFSVQEAPENKYGHPLPDGSWSGLLGEVMNKRADLGLGAVTITPQREAVVDFTRRVLDRGIGLLFRRPSIASEFFSCLSPFEPSLWTCLSITVFLIGLMVHRLNHLQHPPHSRADGGAERTSSHGSGLASTIWALYSSLVQQGGEPVLTSVSARVMLAVWWFFTLIVVSSYTASLAAFLTLSRLATPISSLQELARQTDVTFGTVLHSALYEQLHARALNPSLPEYSTYAHLWAIVSRNNGSENCVRNVAEGLDRVKRGGYAFLWDTAVLEHAALSDDECTLSVRNMVYDKGYGLALQQGSPFKDVFSQRLLELQENGELEALRQKWWPRHLGKCDPYGSPLSPAHPQGLDLPGLAGAFAILAVGLLLACLLGACEVCRNSHPRNLCPPKPEEEKEINLETVQQKIRNLQPSNLRPEAFLCTNSEPSTGADSFFNVGPDSTVQTPMLPSSSGNDSGDRDTQFSRLSRGQDLLIASSEEPVCEDQGFGQVLTIGEGSGEAPDLSPQTSVTLRPCMVKSVCFQAVAASSGPETDEEQLHSTSI